MRLKQFDGVTQYCLNLCCDALRYVLKDSVKGVTVRVDS